MPIVFAAAMGHAPGITAWSEAAPQQQREAVYEAFEELRASFAAAAPEAVILLTSEHWTNFFLDHIGAFVVGRAERYEGPVEPWLGVARRTLPGDPALASALVGAAYANEIEVSFAYEAELDHGSIVPLHFLSPEAPLPVVPIFFNTLAAPQPSAARAFKLGRVVGNVAAAWDRRVALVATGGMSHDPGERRHGFIDTEFDRRFLERMAKPEAEALQTYRSADFQAAGAGTFELLAWIALRGAIGLAPGRVIAYEPVVPWATGIGLMSFDLQGVTWVR